MSAESLVSIPKRQMLSDDVYDAIKVSILTGRIPAGSKINLEELRRDTGVSNTPIRQALSRLEAEGLVVKEAYRGFAVAEPPDAARLEEIFEVRLILEPATAALAAARATPAEIDHLRQLTEDALTDPAVSAELDGPFHAAIDEAAKNSVLKDELDRVRGRRFSYNSLFDVADYAERTWAEHKEILDALVDGDATSAEAAMRRHLELSRDRHRAEREKE